MVTAYENGLHETAERLRNYVYQQKEATTGEKTITFLRRDEDIVDADTLAIHAHYSALLETSRNETLQAQLTHQAWQASVQRVAEGVRLAHAEKTDQSLPYRKRIAALKEENRLLRMKAGWDPPSDSEDEDEFDDDEEVPQQQQQQPVQGQRPMRPR